MNANALKLRVDVIAEQARAREKNLRATNRELMPLSASIIDEFRRVFGALSYIRCEEGGRVVEWGKRSAEGVAVPVSRPAVRAKRA